MEKFNQRSPNALVMYCAMQLLTAISDVANIDNTILAFLSQYLRYRNYRTAL